jgi:adenylate kinase family enzyme
VNFYQFFYYYAEENEVWGINQLQRIVVIGVSGSGKTTFAHQLALRLGYPHIEMDAVHWLPNWVEMPTERFRDQIKTLASADAWVMDGNYSKVRDIVWARSDTIVWLDYPLPVILSRLLRRTMRRVVTRETLWNGNRENLQNHLKRDSVIVWALRTYPRYRRTYPMLFQQPEYSHLKVARLTTPNIAQLWLDQQR